MKKLRNGFAAPLILLIVCLLVGAGAVFAYFQYKHNPVSRHSTIPNSKQDSPSSSEINNKSSNTQPNSWKKCETANLKPKLVAGTETWKQHSVCDVYKFIDTEGDQYPNAPFVFKIPSTWQYSGGVFNDENGRKRAEGDWVYDISRTNSCDQTLLDWPAENTISVKNIKIGTFEGNLQIWKQDFEGGYDEWTGTWYPYRYCLKNGQKAFSLTFYKDSLSDKSDIFEKILSTVDFPSDNSWYSQ